MISVDVFLPALFALILFFNSLLGEFCYDDSRAIKRNPDVLGETSLWSLFGNDFWGTPLLHSGSHKSYRPLCTLTFRFNYALAGLDPFGFRAFNIVLHSLTTALYSITLRNLFGSKRISLLAGLLFASHPIHTEAVSGIVGRADVLSCLFFLLAFNSYISYCDARDADSCSRDEETTAVPNGILAKHVPAEVICQRPPHHTLGTHATTAGKNPVDKNEFNLLRRCQSTKTWLHVIGFVSCVLCAMLSKEQGVTVVFLCLFHDIFIKHKLPVYQIYRIFREDNLRSLRRGIILNLIVCIAFVSLRLYLIGMSPPTFSPSDNPASDNGSLLTRTLTFYYLPALNFGLLLCPAILSFDWSMDAIELITSLTDLRNIVSASFYLCLLSFIIKLILNLNTDHRYLESLTEISNNFKSQVTTDQSDDNITLKHFNSVSSTSANFRAKNLVKHFPNALAYSPPEVTFTPDDHPDRWHVLLIGLSFMILPYIPASNLFFYVGFVLAERVLYIPSMGFCLIVALGIHLLILSEETKVLHRVDDSNCYDEQNLLSKNSKNKNTSSYKNFSIASILSFPIGCFPRRSLGQMIGDLRIRPGLVTHFCVFLLLTTFSWRTFLRNKDWLTEESLYKSGIPVNPAKAWGNLANVLNARGKAKEAEQAYKTALLHRNNMADVHYNLGILYQEQGRHSEAIQSYEKAIQCRPRLTMAHLNLGIVLALMGRKSEAEQVYRHCSEMDTSGLKDPRLHEHTKISALYNLGRLMADVDRHEEAVRVYLKAIERRPAHYPAQSIYNMLGESYARLDQLDSAEFYYKMALQVKPNHIPAHLTLAKLYHRQGLSREAEKLYAKARSIDPKDHTVHQHYGQFLADTGRAVESVDSYCEAARLAPSDFEVIFNSANALRSVGRNREAEEYYRRATELQPETALTHMNLGAMLHYNGKLEEAEGSYLKALELKSGDAVTLSNLNKLRSLMGKRNHKRT